MIMLYAYLTIGSKIRLPTCCGIGSAGPWSGGGVGKRWTEQILLVTVEGDAIGGGGGGWERL